MNTTDRPPSRLPAPDMRTGVSMRDGAKLDTLVWLPKRTSGPFPALLIRSPYSRAISGVNEAPMLAYLEAGYALVMSQIRGIGRSEGVFAFNAPHDRTDGYDTIEWIAGQDWCTGAVGMDGHSYAAMTQLTAAVARPPHLKCIAPAVPSLDFFAEPPYVGGVFSRMHTLVWGQALQFQSMLDEDQGAFALNAFLTDPSLLERWLSRPLTDAAAGVLGGALAAHYRDVLAHPTFDDWWKARTLGPADFAKLDLPVLVVSGNFDPSVGALKLWRGLEQHAANAQARQLIIGPWNHNEAYNGGGAWEDAYSIASSNLIDLVGLRLAFFDEHLKHKPRAASARVRLFVTGANRWVEADAFPKADPRILHLSSEGHANSSRGDGRLQSEPPGPHSPSDHFLTEPDWPTVDALTPAKGPRFALDLRERERTYDTLVYASDPLPAPMTLLGESELELFTAADAPDADIAVWLAEGRRDGASIMLGFGQIRLRYRGGFETETLLKPGEVARVRISITYVAHRLAPGSTLRLLVSGTNFPLLDPNPHSAEPIATARGVRRATQTIFHDAARPSRLLLPVIADGHA